MLSVMASQAWAAADGTLATVNGVAVREADLEPLLRASGQPDSPALRHTITQGLIAREVLRQAAQRERLGDTPEVREAVRKARVDTQNRLYVQRHAKPQPVTEAEVRARYDAIVSELGPQEYQLGMLAFTEEPPARVALSKLARGESFAAVSGMRVALPWVSFKVPAVEGHTTGLPMAVASAIPTAKDGEPLLVNAGVLGYRVVQVQARRPTVVPTYEQARAPLRAALEAQAQAQAFSALIDSLTARATIVQAAQK